MFCGGPSKSIIFDMHTCEHTVEQIEAAEDTLSDAIEALQEAIDTLREKTEKGETDANTVQDVFGQVGDPDASNLAQQAKVQAGEYIHLTDKANELIDNGMKKRTEAGDAKGKDLKKLDNANDAERALQGMNTAIPQLIRMEEKIQAALADSFPDESDSTDIDHYVSIMTYVDNHQMGGIHTDAPATCTGKLLHIVFDQDEAGCAATCDDWNAQGCTGFQYFEEGGLCFLLKNVKKVQYYTGCGHSDTGEEEFLQVKKAKKTGHNAPFQAMCYVKLADFESVGDLKNRVFQHASHANSYGLKELTKADRCYELP